MINKLFSMHNIKYIISVDDCFFAQKRDEMEATVYSEMCRSLEPFMPVLSTSSQAAKAGAIAKTLELGMDASFLVRPLVGELELEGLQKCYEICEKNGIAYAEERDRILAFLEGLKSGGQIKKYLTFPSVAEANRFDANEAGMVDGAILWLLDRNFSRVGESADAGLALAENLVQRKDGINKYIYVLSAVNKGPEESEDEDDIEMEFDKLLAENCSACSPEEHSFIYYIDKQRVLSSKSDRIAKSLAQGFKRKACYELFQLFSDCLLNGLSDAATKIQSVRQKSLNYLFTNKIKENGESYIDFAGRFVQLFHYDGYHRAIAENYTKIAEKAKLYESLYNAVPDKPGNAKELTSILKEYREIELYNQHINAQHCEVATGDIFKIKDSYYLLVSQSCDTYLRKDGERKLKEATLLEISDDGTNREYSYRLSCFSTMKAPTVVYHSLKIFPFEILDLCTFDTCGQAMLFVDDIAGIEEKLKLYTENYRLRFRKVLETFRQIYTDRATLQKFWDNAASVSAEEVCKAYAALDDIDPDLKKYEFVGGCISFPVKRICRLNELTTIDIIKGYGAMLSRIGQPFDFTDNSQLKN